jgi:prevent-host-death family protein
MQVNIREAQTRFSWLVEQALRGEEVIIARSGKPLLKLVPLAEPPKARTPGLSQGKIRIAEDFDSPSAEDIIREFGS